MIFTKPENVCKSRKLKKEITSILGREREGSHANGYAKVQEHIGTADDSRAHTQKGSKVTNL